MNTNGHDGKRVEKVAEHVDKASEAAHMFYEEARDAGQSLAEAVDLKGRVERNPYGTVAIALGAGYLLGGGLFTATTARLVRLGVKLAAVPIVRDQLLTLAESAIDGALDRSKKSNQAAQARVANPGSSHAEKPSS
jgi:hypothetical protein